MNFIYIGDIVNTHGIKGEVRIISNFKYKNNVFLSGINLYIGKEKTQLQIASYRQHKNFDQVIFSGKNDINEVLEYKGQSVYINREEINIDGYFNEDLIGMNAFAGDKLVGQITDILNNGIYDIFVIENGKVRNLVPYINEFIKNIDIEKKYISINAIEGLLNDY